MKCYILGAGVSKTAGYPVGSELFGEIDKYVRESGNLHDRFEYAKKWPEMLKWLDSNADPIIAQAHRTKDVEALLTALDFAAHLEDNAWQGATSMEHGTSERTSKFSTLEAFITKIKEYKDYRNVLLWALIHYFEWRHYEDFKGSRKRDWDILKAFAARLNPGDAVITFNYDASLERVLLEQGKWSPTDGYGFDIRFQKSRLDKTPANLGKSLVSVLHLHGAIGWYRRPAFAPDYVLPSGHEGALPRDAFGVAPLDTKISLDAQFLQALGISEVDASLPDGLPVAQERQIVIHPSFLKKYETDESESHVFPSLWKKAADVLRAAEHTHIIGYSLPEADVAVWTLLITTLRPGAVTVVNRDRRAIMRLGRLFSSNWLADALSLEQWLSANCSSHTGSRPWKLARQKRSSECVNAEAKA